MRECKLQKFLPHECSKCMPSGEYLPHNVGFSNVSKLNQSVSRVVVFFSNRPILKVKDNNHLSNLYIFDFNDLYCSFEVF